jgi:replication factor C small subunit
MPEIISELLWVERHRPKTLDAVALSDEHRNTLRSYLMKGEFPHLRLTGPPGTGKTTCARVLIAAVDCQVLSLNASSDRGIDTIRGDVSEFVRIRSKHRWNVVYLEEADRLTPEAQDALRNTMELYAAHSRFVLTANHPFRLTEAIKSRTTPIEILIVPPEERLRILHEILIAEGVPDDVEAAWSYASAFTDLRRMITAAEQSYAAHGKLVPVHTIHVTGQMLYSGALQRHNFGELKRFARAGSFDPHQALRDMFWAIPDGAPNAHEHAAVIARAINELGTAPDPIVHFLGTCAKLATMQ